MKKFIVLWLFIFSSCHKDNCVDYFINNKTSNSVEIIFFEKNLATRNVIILTNRSANELSICDVGGNSLTYSIFDSIHIKKNNNLKKKYYPDGLGKNIFKTQNQEYWQLTESRDNYSKFVFEITEQDLQ